MPPFKKPSFCFTIHFLDTNIVIPLGTYPDGYNKPVELMKKLAKEMQNAGWAITEDLSHAVTGYPQITLEANTDQNVILQVSDDLGDS